MRKRRNNAATKNETFVNDTKPGGVTIFKFGDPEPVLSNNIADYLGVFAGSGDYYEPPVSLDGLSKILRANGHHGTIPPFRRDRLIQHYKTWSLS